MEQIGQILKDQPGSSQQGTPAPKTSDSNSGDDLISRLKWYNLSTASHRFSTFDRLPGTENAIDLMQAVASGESDRKYILLYGKAGCGKTHLIEATLIELINGGIHCHYLTMSEYVRAAKGLMRQSNDGYDRLFQQLCRQSYLVMDDVGMGTIESRWEISELEDIINERYHRRYYPDMKMTIIATNKNPEELPERVLSRFCDPEFGAVVFMDVKTDYRRRKV